MKKLLAMVLALVMTLSLAVSANAFKDDKSISDDYAEAVAVLNGMGVFKGYEDGSFQPKGDITRAEVSAIVYRVYTQDVKDAKASMYATYNKFSDMAGAGWAQGYIGYCANAELVKGYPDGTFKPSGKVTGYEVLAMILRAVGYDKNGEFSGADWTLHVAQTAQQAGVLKNVKGIDLNAPATRELVAELLFRAVAESSMVTYTPAFGYVTDKVLGNTVSTLGYKNFKLEGKADADSFGRPATKWTYNVGDKSTLVVAKADASYTTKVSECDIAKDLGISKTAKVEKVYTDGIVNATGTNNITSINALKTTSIVGGQGRLTEVYNMGTAGYRIVEINTYLAKVTKVNAAYTDKNGHTVDASINLVAYSVAAGTSSSIQTTAFVNVDATGYAVGDYVLVTISNPNTYVANVESVEKANVAASGTYKGFTVGAGTAADTTKLGETFYNDADKFFLNYRQDGNWDALADTYGNIIGLVSSAKNYLVIEAARWLGDGSTTLGGKAIANIVLADGTRLQNVTIASVGDKNANGYSIGNDAGNPATAGFDTTYTSNEKYYNCIVAYSVNADGSYALAYNTKLCAGTANLKEAVISNGQTIMSGTNEANNTAIAVGINDTTVFLVKGADGTYTTYTGKDNVPSMTKAKVCYLASGNYATLVVVSESSLASNTFDAYVDADASFTGYSVGGLGYAFTVYKEGSDEATTIYYGQTSLPLYLNGRPLANRDGVYTFTVNSKNQLVDANGLAYGATGAGTISAELVIANELNAVTGSADAAGRTGKSYTWDRTYILTNDGNNMYRAANNTDTYWVNNATYFEVSYNTAGAMTGLKKVDSYQSIDWTSRNVQVLVAYKTVANVKQAQYVYVINQSSNNNTTVPTASLSVDIQGIVRGQRIDATATTVTGTYGSAQNVSVPVVSTVWYRYNADGTRTACAAGDVFANGQSYVAEITVAAPANGVELGTTVTTVWNQASATISGNVISYTFSF